MLSLHDALPIYIAAASSLKFALEEVAARCEADTGRKVALSFGSSGNFYRQIIQGAPFQMFLSADEGFVEQLAGAGKTVDRGRQIGRASCRERVCQYV